MVLVHRASRDLNNKFNLVLVGSGTKHPIQSGTDTWTEALTRILLKLTVYLCLTGNCSENSRLQKPVSRSGSHPYGRIHEDPTVVYFSHARNDQQSTLSK